MIKLNINRNPLDLGVMYKKSELILNPGLTILVGCNGSGKTTIIRQAKEFANRNGIPVFQFSNLEDGGSNAISAAMFNGNFGMVNTMYSSSEGEGIYHVLESKLNNLGYFVKREKSNGKDSVICTLDAVDSGMSIDNVFEIKYGLKDIITFTKEKMGVDLYFVISANSYELARDEKCLDVVSGEYVTFKDYEDYRKFIIKSRHKKDVRNKRWSKHQERKR